MTHPLFALKRNLEVLLSNVSNNQNFGDALLNIFTGFLHFLTFGFVKDSFKTKVEEIVLKLGDFKKNQQKNLTETKIPIESYFAELIKKLDSLAENKNTTRIKRIVWYDVNVNNSENSSYQEKINSTFKSIELIKFSDITIFKNFVKNLNKPSILITSGSSHKTVFEMCYHSKYITDIIIFAFDLTLYDGIRKSYDKVYRVTDSIETVIKSIYDILSENTTNWVLPLNNLNSKIVKINSDYAYKNFNQIPLSTGSYQGIINKAIQLQLATKSNAEQEVNKFLSILIKVSNKDQVNIAKQIIHLYTCESLFYKLVNQVLKDLNEENIIQCEIWIKALNLALRTMNVSESSNKLKLFRCVRISGLSVEETYKKLMAICFPAFTSTSANENAARAFINDTCECFILFEINYVFKNELNPPVSIGSVSQFKIEDEYLFKMFSIFYIDDISRIDDNNFKITLSNN